MMKFVSPAKDGAAVAFYIYRNHVISATHVADVAYLQKAKKAIQKYRSGSRVRKVFFIPHQEIEYFCMAIKIGCSSVLGKPIVLL